MGPANMLISFLLYSSRALPVAVMGLVASQLRLQPQHHHRQHHQHQQQQRPRQAHSATPPGPGQNAAGPTDADAGAASAPAGRAVASRLLGGGLLMALAAGCLGAGALAWGSEALVVAVGVQEPSLLQPAARYLRIRALALPAVLLTMVAQSGAPHNPAACHCGPRARTFPLPRCRRLGMALERGRRPQRSVHSVLRPGSVPSLGSHVLRGGCVWAAVAQASLLSRTASRHASAWPSWWPPAWWPTWCWWRSWA